MPIVKIKKDGQWIEVTNTLSDADTLDGKHADAFALATELNELQNLVDEQIDNVKSVIITLSDLNTDNDNIYYNASMNSLQIVEAIQNRRDVAINFSSIALRFCRLLGSDSSPEALFTGILHFNEEKDEYVYIEAIIGIDGKCYISMGEIAAIDYVDEQIESIKPILVTLDENTGKASMTSTEIGVELNKHREVGVLFQGVVLRYLKFDSSGAVHFSKLVYDIDATEDKSLNVIIVIDTEGKYNVYVDAIATYSYVNNAISNHNESADAHSDIRAAIDGLDADKLDSSALSSAIDTALAQAKVSGEFDGAAGTTPVKGTDYFTDAEKTEMVAQVKAAMPTLTVTGIDENGVSHTWLIYGVSQE